MNNYFLYVIRRNVLRRRKMFKKILMITLSLILCLALFTGCGTTKTLIKSV